MKTSTTKTIGQLSIGSVINYTNDVIAMNVDYKIQEHVVSYWGMHTVALNMKTNQLENFPQHTAMSLRWSIVKEN